MDFLAQLLLGYTPLTLQDVVDSLPEETTSETSEAPEIADDLFALAAQVEEKKDTKTQPKTKEKKATKSKDIDMLSIPTESLVDYACEDADITFQLAELLAEKLDESGQADIFYDIESPLLPVIVDIEHEGISVNTDALADISKTLGHKIASLTEQIYQQAGKEFNLNSPKQLGTILFEEMQLVEKPKKTKTGQFKTDESTLAALANQHKIVADILEYREASKLKSTYVDALPPIYKTFLSAPKLAEKSEKHLSLAPVIIFS